MFYIPAGGKGCAIDRANQQYTNQKWYGVLKISKFLSSKSLKNKQFEKKISFTSPKTISENKIFSADEMINAAIWAAFFVHLTVFQNFYKKQGILRLTTGE